MSLAKEFDSKYSTCLYASEINNALGNHDVEEIAQFIRSSENFESIDLRERPVNEELGRQISDAIAENSHIRELRFYHGFCEIRDLVAWIGSRNTLVNMTSLESVWVDEHSATTSHNTSVLDCSALFSLLLTSTTLRKFDILFGPHIECSDDVTSALLSYLGTASLTEFGFGTHGLAEGSLPEAAFTALCDGVALSTVRRFTLWQYDDVLQKFNLETVAESLARMIVESSSLEEVTMDGCKWESTWRESLISALKLTAPVRNMDFAFTQIGDDRPHLRINRKWKPLFSGNTPLALWPHILEKSHASPETSHGSADIVFYVLGQKPDLVPAL